LAVLFLWHFLSPEGKRKRIFQAATR